MPPLRRRRQVDKGELAAVNEEAKAECEDHCQHQDQVGAQRHRRGKPGTRLSQLSGSVLHPKSTGRLIPVSTSGFAVLAPPEC